MHCKSSMTHFKWHFKNKKRREVKKKSRLFTFIDMVGMRRSLDSDSRNVCRCRFWSSFGKKKSVSDELNLIRPAFDVCYRSHKHTRGIQTRILVDGDHSAQLKSIQLYICTEKSTRNFIALPFFVISEQRANEYKNRRTSGTVNSWHLSNHKATEQWI